jgi:hypothetical protein
MRDRDGHHVAMPGESYSSDPALRRIAQRLFWWKPPGEALADPWRFAAQVMTLGNWEDVQVTRSALGDDYLRETLRKPPAGVFDERSWSYWHAVFDIAPAPPLPRRSLP